MGVTRVIDKSDKFRINDFLIDFHEKRRTAENLCTSNVPSQQECIEET
jgi:hypothetical protein